MKGATSRLSTRKRVPVLTRSSVRVIRRSAGLGFRSSRFQAPIPEDYNCNVAPSELSLPTGYEDMPGLGSLQRG